jgi:hypothetical protein
MSPKARRRRWAAIATSAIVTTGTLLVLVPVIAAALYYLAGAARPGWIERMFYIVGLGVAIVLGLSMGLILAAGAEVGGKCGS